MNGIELSRKFFEEYGKPMAEKEFPDIIHLLAFGLCGSGSECFGFDDIISRDHDYDAGFCIFIPDIIDSRTEYRLERAYSRLPKEFEGVKRNILSPVGGNRKGIIRTSDFFMQKTGTKDGRLSVSDWFSLPDSALAEATNGEIFEDRYGEVTEIRQRLENMPEDIRLKKIASNLLNMGQAGQYNYARCIKRNETGAAQLAVFEFVRSGMRTVFLLNGKFMPYYKWSFRAMRELPVLPQLSEAFEFLISSDNTEGPAQTKQGVMEDIALMIINELKNQEVTKADCQSLEKHAYSVNDFIKDPEIRNLNIFAAL